MARSRYPAAHGGKRLPLLPSGPGGVRAAPSHRAHSSMLRISPNPQLCAATREFGSAKADCRCRAPLSPRLARPKRRNNEREWQTSNQAGLNPSLRAHHFNGGQGGIRTHEAVTPTRVPVVLLKPLGHLSKTTSFECGNFFKLHIQNPADRLNGQGGIRTPDALACITVFETAAFDLSATCP